MRNKFLFFILSLFVLFIFSSINLKFDKNFENIKLCKDLNYFEQEKIKPENFSKINLKIKFLDERDWRTTNIIDHINSKKLGKIGWAEHFTNRKRSEAEIILFKNDLKCKLKARIRAHGDMHDHRDGAGLPSLNINLVNGHIFGITKFLLLRPETRGWDNEIFTTTLISNLGFLSPRTATSVVEYDNNKSKFIFQEKIEKEFLEFNNLKEGPIFDGDERFLFIDPLNNLEFKKHKLVNENWIKENKEKEYISLIGFSKLNEIQSLYQAKYTQFVVDYAELVKKKNYDQLFLNIDTFDSLIFALRAEHALSMNDRIFYYDHNYKKFVPIFYDGQSFLLNKLKLINEEKFVSINELTEKSNLVNGRVSYSSIRGADKARVILNSMNKEKLIQNLNERGFEINKGKLNEILKKMSSNLDRLKDFSGPRIFEVQIKENKKITDDISQYNKKFKRKSVFFDENFNNFLECEPGNKESCQKIDRSKIDLTKLLSQKIKKNGNHLVFYGKKNIFQNSNGWFHKNSKLSSVQKFNEKENYVSNNLKFITYGEIDYDLKSEKNEISFFKNSEYGTVLIHNSNLEDWKISFVNNFQSNNTSRTDYNFLTGCLNIYDSFLKRVNIKTFSADCEDSLNIVRSIGDIEDISVVGAKFDAIDFDFSKIKINKAIVKNAFNDCLDFSYGFYEIKKLSASSCGDKGVSVGENSRVILKNYEANNVKIGLASKDNAKTFIDEFKVNNVGDCLSAYNKKQEFSGGFIDIKKFECNNYKNLQVKDVQSMIKIN